MKSIDTKHRRCRVGYRPIDYSQTWRHQLLTNMTSSSTSKRDVIIYSQTRRHQQRLCSKPVTRDFTISIYWPGFFFFLLHLLYFELSFVFIFTCYLCTNYDGKNDIGCVWSCEGRKYGTASLVDKISQLITCTFIHVRFFVCKFLKLCESLYVSSAAVHYYFFFLKRLGCRLWHNSLFIFPLQTVLYSMSQKVQEKKTQDREQTYSD